ncbi:MAG: hypothetical protein VKJ06_06515 [Vampirovibrionales bacterium]|nr:hypothetical protein [Vampirovibrionales bacterium]
MSQFRRWYDHDPLLLEVLELLRAYPDELHAQSAQFIDKLQSVVGLEAIAAFDAMLAHKTLEHKTGHRWYDEDPVVYKAVELLRLSPPMAQRQAAKCFLDALKHQAGQSQ